MIFFNKDIVSKIELPSLDFSLEIENYGIIRFFENEITHVYICVRIKNSKEWKSECMLKYQYNNGKFIYTNIYLSPIYKVRTDINYDYRYDTKMNLESIYQFISPDKCGYCESSYTDIMCIKIFGDGKPRSDIYRWPDPNGKEFTDYVKKCIEKKIIKNTDNYMCDYFNREGSTYLMVGRDRRSSKKNFGGKLVAPVGYRRI